MAYVPDFENDIFISYTHVDNVALSKEQEGWVSIFDNALRIRLSQLLEREPIIWRDRKIDGNDVFIKEAFDQLPKLKILISILSPRYMKSKWCRKELAEFHKIGTEQGGVRVGNKLRIFKVIKTPVPHEQHPPEIRDVLGYEFFEEDENGHFREFELRPGSPSYNKFIERFEDMAQDLRQLIQMLDAGAQLCQDIDRNGVDAAPEKTVYLATTTSDLQPARDNIRRDLEERGYTILPDKELSTNGHFREMVTSELQKCKLAIHLIGSKYGTVQEDETISIPEVQYKLSQQADLTRLIWIPPNLTSEDERQQRFIASLQNEAVVQKNTELLSNKLEDLKTIVIDALENLTPLAEAPGAARKDSAPDRIYLMFDESDREAVADVEDYLFDEGFEVLPLVIMSNESETRKVHQETLQLCDAVLIYCNHAGEPWLRFHMNELLKMPGYGREKPLKASGVYLGGEKERFKERFRSREVDCIIKQFGEFQSSDLAPFVERIREGGENE